MRAVTGVVPLQGRGDVPYSLLHGTPLFVHVVRALHRVPGVQQVLVIVPEGDEERAREQLGPAAADTTVRGAGELATLPAGPVLLMDPLCPLTPASFAESVLERARAAPDRVWLGYRPVTDTLKTVVDHRIVGTVNRDGFALVTSPVFLPSVVVEQVVEQGRHLPTDDLVALLLAVGIDRIELVKAPSLARRVDDDSAVSLLECLEEIDRAVTH